MNAHLSELELNDLADGEMSPAERSRLEAHVSICAACRGELSLLQTMLGELHALPLALPPERDLLEEIHTRIDGEQVIRPASWFRERTIWAARYSLAAAAIMLIIATTLLTRMLYERPSPPAATREQTGATRLVNNEVADLEANYTRAIDELRQLITAQRAVLNRETLQLLENNLRVIDRAIRESRAALQQDPHNEMVTQMLWSAYELKLDLLRRATAAPAT